MKPSLSIFYTIDQNFLVHFTVSVISLIENNTDLDLDIYLIYSFTGDSRLEDTAEFIRQKYEVKLTLIFQTSEMFSNYTINKHVSISTYLRLLLADILPDHIDQGLFIDADTVVPGSLKALSTLRFAKYDDPKASEADKYIYAVSEVNEYLTDNAARLTQMGYPTNCYFNAGVMLICLKNWRSARMSAQLIQIASANMEHLEYWDQDVLNIRFVNKWQKLDPKYNALHLIWKLPETPVIIHYVGSPKPWNYINIHPYRALYYQYLILTPFSRNRYIDFSFKKVPERYYRDAKHFLNYFRQKILGNI